MTNENARFLLNLPDDADNDTIKATYNELYSDYQMRLTNAPTPNLKKLYQKNLQELEEARDLLLAGGGAFHKNELPSATPSFETHTAKSPTPATTPPVVVEERSNSSATKTAPAAPKASTPKKASSPNGFWIIATIVLGALAVLLGTLWFQLRSDHEEAQAKVNQMEAVSKVLKNSKFKVKNLSSKPLTVFAVTIVYLTADNQFKKYEGPVDKTLRPGETQALEDVQGSTVKWNGDVVFYVCHMDYQGTRISQGGVYLSDFPDGVIEVNFDKLLQ